VTIATGGLADKRRPRAATDFPVGEVSDCHTEYGRRSGSGGYAWQEGLQTPVDIFDFNCAD
jgi:hypothetical protein